MNVKLAIGTGNWVLKAFSATKVALRTSLLDTLLAEHAYWAIKVTIVIDRARKIG